MTTISAYMHAKAMVNIRAYILSFSCPHSAVESDDVCLSVCLSVYRLHSGKWINVSSNGNTVVVFFLGTQASKFGGDWHCFSPCLVGVPFRWISGIVQCHL